MYSGKNDPEKCAWPRRASSLRPLKCYSNALITLISKDLDSVSKYQTLESTWPRTRDGNDTDTKYRYCRYLRVRVKYRYFHQVSLVFDTEPTLFMVSMCVKKPQENVNQIEEKAEKCEFFFWKYV